MVLQDAEGQVAEARVDRGRARLPGRRAGARAPGRDRPGRVLHGHRRRGARGGAAGWPGPRGSSARSSRRTRWPGCCARPGRRELPAGSTVLLTLSGRGDKDMAHAERGRRMSRRNCSCARREPATAAGALRHRRHHRRLDRLPARLPGRRARTRSRSGCRSPTRCSTGSTIQQASDRALARGATVDAHPGRPRRGPDRLRVPLIAMTYANLVFRAGPAGVLPAAGRRPGSAG